MEVRRHIWKFRMVVGYEESEKHFETKSHSPLGPPPTMRSYSKQVQLACTVPGIAPVAAASILAEIGMDMSPEGPFPDCHHLASWAAICPGNNESAGKIKSGHTRRGNRWLRATLAQTALAGAAKKNSRFQTRYQRLKLRRV